MGCSICLDDFDQADGEEKRATALPCGHIFHGNCLYQWFYASSANATNRLAHQRRCPLCSKPTDPASQIRLYPSDGDDLSTYLSGQRLNEFVLVDQNGTTSAGHNSDHTRLLNDLLDFNSAMQSYVMAMHRVHTDTMLKAGVRLRRLVKDLTKDSGQNLDLILQQAMNGLHNAGLQFSNLRNQLERRSLDLKVDQLKLEAEKAALQHKVRKADELLKEREQAKAAVTDRLALASAKWDEATRIENQNDVRDKQLQERRNQLDAIERAFKHKQAKVDRDNRLQISNMQAKLNEQLRAMTSMMNTAIKERDEAIQDRMATHSKNCALAQQLRELQEKLKAKASHPKKAHASKSANANMSDLAAKERTIQALRAQNQALEAQLTANGISTPVRRLVRRNPNQRLSQHDTVDLTRSSPSGIDEDFSPATPLDGLSLASQASAAAGPKSPTTPSRRGAKRARTSLSIEPERLEQETDEALFPMPGIPGAGPLGVRAGLHRRLGMSDPAVYSSSSHAGPLARHVGEASGSTTVRKTPPCASQKKSKARDTACSKENAAYGWLNSATAVQLGPKRKPRA